MIKLDDRAHRELAIWAANCAEHILFRFEAQYQNDTRVRDAIEAARSWSIGNLKISEARKFAFASHAAARNASQPESIAAARSAGHAAATAHSANHARYAAIYAAKASPNPKAEIEWQWSQLPENMKPKIEPYSSCFTKTKHTNDQNKK